MRILVVGSGGTCASLVDALVENNEVVVLGPSDMNPKARFVKGNILDIDIVREAMSGCDIVYHLASKFESDPERSYELNVLGSKNVFSAAAENDAKVVFASSAAVYGNVPQPVNEDSDCNPVSHFGWHLLQAERMCPPSAFIVRLFNVYGPRCESVINEFCERLLHGKELVIRGTGLQTRDFVYIDDVISALLKGLTVSGLYNIGSGKDRSILSVVHMLEQILGKVAELRFEPGVAWEVSSRADISRARRELGWSPTIGLRSGLNKLIDFLRT